MKRKGEPQEELEIEKLRAELAETKETLRAIQSGEVDALIISGAQGEQVFTLKGAEQPYRMLIEEMKEGAVTLEDNGTIIYCNQGFAGMLKMPLEKVIGIEFSQFVSPTDKPVFEELLQQGRAGGSRGEITFLAGDGTAVPVHLSVNTMQLNESPAVYLVATDITERKQAEKALKKAHDELERKVLERTAELAKANEELHVEIAERKRAEEEVRRARDELEIRVRERTTELEEASIKLEESNVELEAEIAEHKQAEEQIREQAELLDKAHDSIVLQDLEHRIIYWSKGAEHMYGWTADKVTGKNAIELLHEDKSASPQLMEAKKSIIEKGDWIGELQHLTENGEEIIVESRWTLIRDAKGIPKSILTINTDVTEKKRLEGQLLRAQRMESIGTLAGGIAHDLNNVLTPVMLSLQILKGKLPDEESQRLFSILEKNIQRGANLVKQVLSFARGIKGERAPLQVMHIVSEIEKIVKETFPRNIEIQTIKSKDLWTISGDVTQLHQVIMNMCLNARDAMSDGGILSISAENISITEDYARMNTEAKVGPYILISVSDTGTGIPPEILDRIFDPFFTTKEHGKGTGLGLSTSLAIVKSHGGFIDVKSKVGEGTVFMVYLPAIKTEIEKEQVPQVEVPAGHGELVLIAEDEASISEITGSTLQAYGYRVLTADDGASAVALYARNKNEIKVILMDMMMPVMDGLTSVRAIRKIDPEVKIIAVSGLAEKDKLKEVADANVHAFLSKPYTAERLLKTIHEVLSAR